MFFRFKACFESNCESAALMQSVKAKMKGELTLNQIVQVLLMHEVGELKIKGSKLLNQWKGKGRLTHLHTGNTAETTVLNTGFEKS